MSRSGRLRSAIPGGFNPSLALVCLLSALSTDASQLPNHMRVAQRALARAPEPIRTLVGAEESDTWNAYLAGSVALDGLGLRAEAAAAVHGFEFGAHDHERIHELLENAFSLSRLNGSAADQAFALGLVTHFWLDVHEHELVNRFGGYFVSEEQMLRHKRLETLETEHVYRLGDVPVDRAHLVPRAASVAVELLDRAIDRTFGADDRFLGGDSYYLGQESVMETWLASHLADEGEYRRAAESIDQDVGVRRGIAGSVGLAKLPRLPTRREYERIRMPLRIRRVTVGAVDANVSSGAVRPGDAIAIEAEFVLYDRTLLRHYLDAWPGAVAAAEEAIARTFARVVATGTLGLPEMNLDSGLPYGQEGVARSRYANGIGAHPIELIDVKMALVGDASRLPLVHRTLRIVDDSGDGTAELAGPQPSHPPVVDGGRIYTNATGWEDQPILDPARYRETLVLPADIVPGTYQLILALRIGEGSYVEDDVETATLVVGEAQGVDTKVVLELVELRGRDIVVRADVTTVAGARVDVGELTFAAPGGTVGGQGFHHLAGRDFGATVVVRPADGVQAIVLNAVYSGDAIEDGIADRNFNASRGSILLKTLDELLGDAAPGKPTGGLLVLVDAAGRPVPNAKAQATTGDRDDRRIYDLVPGETAELPPGSYEVHASAPFHADAKAVTEVASGNAVTLHLHLVGNPGTLTVTVADTQGEPLPEALASVTGPQPAGLRPAPATFAVNPGTYTVHAEAAGYLARVSDPIEVRPGTPSAVVLQLARVPQPVAARVWINPAWLELEPGDAVGIEVKVFDADNVPIEPTPPTFYAMTDPAVATVDGGGTVSALRRGETHLVVTSGGAHGAIPVRVTSASPLYSCTITNNPVRLRAHGGGHTFRAEARDLEGKLVPGATFEWFSSDYTVALADTASGRVTTEVPGRFTAIAVGHFGDGEATCFADVEVTLDAAPSDAPGDLPGFLGGDDRDDREHDAGDDPLLDWIAAEPGTRPANDLGADGEDLLDAILAEETASHSVRDPPQPERAEDDPAPSGRIDPTDPTGAIARTESSPKPAKRPTKVAWGDLAGRVAGAALNLAATRYQGGRSLPAVGLPTGRPGGGARVLRGTGTYLYEAGPGGHVLNQFRGALSVTIDVARGTWSAEGSDTRRQGEYTFRSNVSLSGSYRGDAASGTLTGTLAVRIAVTDDDGTTSDDLPSQPIEGRLDGSHLTGGSSGYPFFDATVQ